MLYRLIRPLLFAGDAEMVHDLTLLGLRHLSHSGVLASCFSQPSLPVRVMGLEFSNPVGLAAGLDKNASAVNAFGQMGFGFVEVGTVTPKPQEGNPKPRLFRLLEQQALINRMGFNNQGVDALVHNVKKHPCKGILGINIGKNKTTPNTQAESDYQYCYRKVYHYADYVTVNISSPNTPELRELQFGDALATLLDALKADQYQLTRCSGRYVPLVLKIAPDMTTEEIALVAYNLKKYEVDAVIATNTTVSRDGVEKNALAQETGGLSGAPLFHHSTLVISALYAHLQEQVPIIGVGGINHPAQAVEKIKAGAKLVQIYSGLIYQGPELIQSCVQAIAQAEQLGQFKY